MTDQEKWETLYKTHWNRVCAYFVSKIGYRATAEDLCQDVFERAYRAFPGFDESRASAVTWLFTIARNALTDYYRTLHRHEPLDQEPAPDGLTAPDTPEAELLRDETLSLLASALRGLEREDREIIVLHYDRGWTLKEVAERTGISYGMVKYRHRAALKKLRTAMEGKGTVA